MPRTDLSRLPVRCGRGTDPERVPKGEPTSSTAREPPPYLFACTVQYDIQLRAATGKGELTPALEVSWNGVLTSH